MRRVVALVLLLIATAITVEAQGGYFGQNHVQYRKLNWLVLKTEHFDVHYYPELEEAAEYTGRMAERAYARLSRILGHEFRERKPIIIYGSRTEFAQSNVLGDLGEGTGGATDALRQRNMFFFSGDLGEAEHVLAHEMVHVFQFDVFARGRSGGGMQQLAAVNPPLWYMEGMAEYLSIGPNHPHTDAIMRDAALNGDIPSVEAMTRQPNRYFPYRFGESFWRYIADRWGDQVIGDILQSTPGLGIERAFRRFTGIDLEDLGEEWKEDVQFRYLPQVAELERPRRVATPVLNERRTGGIIPVYVAPALSPDGKKIVYISTGNLLRAEVFLDLYLADVATGKRERRITKSTLDPDFEELRFLYSQGSFSPDGNLFVFTAQRRGRDVLYVYDIKRKRVVRRLDTNLQSMMGPSWSPDGQQIVFSGAEGGLSDLYIIGADGKNLRRLTSDAYGDHQPQWSPDGRFIAFASERGPQSNLSDLQLGKWRISIYDLQSGQIEVIPDQDALNLNPMWAPDGQSIAFVSNRTGIPQIFLYDLNERQHFQLTRLVGGVLSMTEISPTMTWAREADMLAFTYQDNGDFTIWSVNNPRLLKKEPFAAATAVIAEAPGLELPALPAAPVTQLSPADTAITIVVNPRRRSVYVGTEGLRPSSTALPSEGFSVSVAALLDSARFALPDGETFRKERYSGSLRAEAVMRPQVGYAQDNFGRGVYGGTAVLMSDMVGDQRLLLAGGINGRLEEAQVFVDYARLANRTQYNLGLQQQPYFFLTDFQQFGTGPELLQTQVITRFIQRSVYAAGVYPLNRFTRLEFGSDFTNVDRSDMFLSQGIDLNFGFATGFFIDSIKGAGSLNYASPFVAYVSDNALFGATGGIYGRRYRFSVQQTAGNVSWTTYAMDYRRYDAVLFNFLTLATRVAANISVGPDETEFPKYIGRPDFVRGYDRELYLSDDCGTSSANPSLCSATQLLGSRVAYANAELRFPLLRRVDLGVLPITLPPVDGLFFYDFGLAWQKGQSLHLTRPDGYDFISQRYPLRSYGFGIRLNLFNIALIRWDYSVPRDAAVNKGYWFWTLGQSF